MKLDGTFFVNAFVTPNHQMEGEQIKQKPPLYPTFSIKTKASKKGGPSLLFQFQYPQANAMLRYPQANAPLQYQLLTPPPPRYP